MSNNNLIPNYGIMKNGIINNINSFNEDNLNQNQILQNKTSRNNYSKDDDINNSFPDIKLLKDLSIPSFVDDFFGIFHIYFYVYSIGTSLS